MDMPERKTPKERYEYGRSLRESTPLESHADWAPDHDRVDPVTLIEEQNRGRLEWLVPERRSRMSRSPFTFFRGAARIMASDLARTPTSGIITQLCGDAHLANFGHYASPERQLVFDLNDFDETLPGPWEWDVKRLAASLFIAARHNGLSKKRSRSVTRRSVRSYRKAMAYFSKIRLTDIWYDLFDAGRILEVIKKTDHYDSARRRLEKYKRKDSRHALDRLAEEVDGEFRIRSDPPLLIPLRDLPDEMQRDLSGAWMEETIEAYQRSVPDEIEQLLNRYHIVDFAYKVVGVGSVGTRCAILLLEGRDRFDPMFLQIKQAGPSVLEEYLPPSIYANSAQRVVQGQRLMQSVSDVFLGWTESKITGNHYYIRQLKDWKGSIDVENVDQGQLDFMADLRGWNLARAHARSGDPIAITGYIDAGKTFDKAITEYSERYAAQNNRDYKAYLAEIKSGRLETTT